MNDEEKKFLTDLIDKERVFHVDLAKIGMKFGAFVSLGVAVFAIGGTLLFSVLEHDYLKSPSIILLIFGIGIIFGSVGWFHTEINKLKKSL